MKKKYLMLATTVLAVAGLGLTACSNGSENVAPTSSSSSSSSSSTTTSSSFSETKAKVDYSLYDETIAAYADVVQGGTSADDINNMANQVKTSMGYYTGIETARYDIDANGVDELLVALVAKDGNRSLLDIRTISDGQVVRLTNSSNRLDSIGERMLVVPLKDGSFLYRGASSATEHSYSLFEFNQAGNELVKTSEGTEESDLASHGEALDLASLSWSSVTGQGATQTATSQKMDLSAIQNGDYSSIEGTWVNGRGNTITFTKDSAQQSGYAISLTTSKVADGILEANISAGMSGALLYMIPAGTVIPDQDTSDTSKDRLFSTQNDLQLNEASYFYYRQ